jgi:hypothetical protein
MDRSNGQGTDKAEHKAEAGNSAAFQRVQADCARLKAEVDSERNPKSDLEADLGVLSDISTPAINGIYRTPI